MSAARSDYRILIPIAVCLAACSGHAGEATSPAVSGVAGTTSAAVSGATPGISTDVVAVAGDTASNAGASASAMGGSSGAMPTVGGAAAPAIAGMPAAGAAGGGAAAAATFTEVFNLLAGGCATGGYCHAAGGGTSKLALVDQQSAYMALVGVPGMGMAAPGSGKTGCGMSMIIRVQASDPDNSLLMQKLEGTQSCGDVMPPGGKLLPDELKLVRDWIAAGAKND